MHIFTLFHTRDAPKKKQHKINKTMHKTEKENKKQAPK